MGWKMCRQLIARCTQHCQHTQHWQLWQLCQHWQYCQLWQHCQHTANSGNTVATQWQGFPETLRQIFHIGSNFPSLRLIAQLTALHFFQFPFSFLFMTGNSLVSAANDRSPSSSQASFSFLFCNSFSAPSSFSCSSFHDVPKPKPA